MSLFIKIVSLHNPINFFANLHPTSLANLVVEVGTRHSRQILLKYECIWATLPKWVPPHIQNWPSPIFMKMHRRIHRCINNRYSKYRHSMNNRFGENELWKVSRASLWHLLGVIEDIDVLILTAFVVQRPSFKKCIHKQKKLLFASPAPIPISKSICETIC